MVIFGYMGPRKPGTDWV